MHQGDLNVAAEDADLSGDPAWWRSQVVLTAQDPGDIGQPGLVDYSVLTLVSVLTILSVLTCLFCPVGIYIYIY